MHLRVISKGEVPLTSSQDADMGFVAATIPGADIKIWDDKLSAYRPPSKPCTWADFLDLDGWTFRLDKVLWNQPVPTSHIHVITGSRVVS